MSTKLMLPLLGLAVGPVHADIFWVGATSNDIFDETNWDLSSSTVTVVDPNVTIDDNIVIAGAAAPVEIADLAGQIRFQVGDGYTLTLDNSTITALGNDGVGGVPLTTIGPLVNVVNGGHLGTYFITNRTSLDLDNSSTATFGGPATPINGSTVDITVGAVLAFTNETVADYINEHLSKTTVDGAPAVVGVNLQVVSDGATGCIVSAISMGPIGTYYCAPAIPNSSGASGIILASGSQVVAANDLTLTADQLPPSQFGYFLNSQTQGFFNPPGSNGFICLGGAIGRYNQPQNIGQGPSFALQIDLTMVPQPTGSVAVQPGDTFNFQAWYRDVANTNNFTDAVSITFQ